MAKLGRNESCPCGSGTKVKRCRGTREAQAALDRRIDALAELVGLPQLFPRLRPTGAAFAEWAEQAAAVEVGKSAVEAGLALVEPNERARIERAHADEFGTATASASSFAGCDRSSALAGLPRASATLEAACDAFEQDKRMQARLSELLLSASLTRLMLDFSAAA